MDLSVIVGAGGVLLALAAIVLGPMVSAANARDRLAARFARRDREDGGEALPPHADASADCGDGAGGGGGDGGSC